MGNVNVKMAVSSVHFTFYHNILIMYSLCASNISNG